MPRPTTQIRKHLKVLVSSEDAHERLRRGVLVLSQLTSLEGGRADLKPKQTYPMGEFQPLPLNNLTPDNMPTEQDFFRTINWYEIHGHHQIAQALLGLYRAVYGEAQK